MAGEDSGDVFSPELCLADDAAASSGLEVASESIVGISIFRLISVVAAECGVDESVPSEFGLESGRGSG